ncbi:DUF2461 domain-containing protein [Parabacteroides sp. PF5-9]|uniref:DUF2461 domain-containing protein n=1 Tax=Parabacteroides sp. PF5-9 TaxID=1742404 RepID=UPI002473B57F|nr:DUF2461 domain-containing protein [Parabacteroides sp. PF5-9]MDH6356331.1 uncharacterized protein (TIGR02453 family) [Parabacteroides sp. PF5-9]
MTTEIFQFLRELSENNNRPWFQENKERYETLRKVFIHEVQKLVDKISLFDPEVAGLEAKDCLYRIYRDIRFSPDKTPYKNYFSAYIAKGGRKSEYGGYYVHLQPDNCLLSGGIWCPPSKLLKMLRQDIYDQIEEFTGIIEKPSFKAVYPKIEGEMLSRMPVGFPADSPYGYILKHKDFTVVSYKPDDYFKQVDWIDRAVEDFKELQPYNRFLNYTVDEYLGRI